MASELLVVGGAAGACLALASVALGQPAAQSPANPVTPATIVTGVVDPAAQTAFPMSALGLGAGGLGRAPVRRGDLRPGQLVTPGGVLVRAQAHGVKLDFPSGSELLVGTDGAVHLRDGGHTAPARGTFELLLADGARLRVRVHPSPRRPLVRAELIGGDTAVLLWDRARPAWQRSRPAPPSGSVMAVLGDGRSLYDATPIGPMLVLERRLVPAAEREQWPQRRVVVAGDLLVAALLELPGHVPPQSVQFPQAPEAAARLAGAAQQLFPESGVDRPAGAVGELIFGLAGGFRLAVEEREADQLFLELHRGDSTIPIVEWRCGPYTSMHLLRPDGGEGGGPRYFLGGIDQSRAARALWPIAPAAHQRRAALAALRAMGARSAVGTVPAAASRRR